MSSSRQRPHGAHPATAPAAAAASAAAEEEARRFRFSGGGSDAAFEALDWGSACPGGGGGWGSGDGVGPGGAGAQPHPALRDSYAGSGIAGAGAGAGPGSYCPPAGAWSVHASPAQQQHQQQHQQQQQQQHQQQQQQQGPLVPWMGEADAGPVRGVWAPVDALAGCDGRLPRAAGGSGNAEDWLSWFQNN
ncbi:hypothetical protein CHLRE_09g390152v5 [Chlamydomonas reinhardtii]|uniref:Uncharacterized protein n=1 Tax=Chlamydomonas reinhardtii TaxID=3055 RepID=A0A2K3DDK0_CHLRE|nr:uncharacterized protein CHLRE_09g390152v5 [Chlamydomonas reinhardtii]PNW78608.1 hypothetical protein CHLRE_09g390152v5 [Chlamydomonas reinhardtii]